MNKWYEKRPGVVLITLYVHVPLLNTTWNSHVFTNFKLFFFQTLTSIHQHFVLECFTSDVNKEHYSVGSNMWHVSGVQFSYSESSKGLLRPSHVDFTPAKSGHSFLILGQIWMHPLQSFTTSAPLPSSRQLPFHRRNLFVSIPISSWNN